jgi:signal transduction histidine kinase
MGQLTGGVAHDFNNLLHPILGALDLLQRRKVGDERERRLVSAALQSGERARTLVQRLLAFARRQPLQPSAADVRQVLEGMAELVSSSTGPQIKVLIDLPALERRIADNAPTDGMREQAVRYFKSVGVVVPPPDEELRFP